MTHTLSATAWALTLGWVAFLYIKHRHKKTKNSSSLPLPPGPPGLPWIGNIFGINKSAPWLTYREWSNTYGDLVYSRLFGKDIIVINSEKIAKDLLENRSGNYSDRPYLITNDLCGIGFNSVMLPYGDTWRLHRRFFHQTFRADAVHRFLPVQHRRACQLLRQLLDSPERLDEHVFEYTASVILSSVYDYDPPSENDELIGMAAKVLEVITQTITPEIALVVAAFPLLLDLPSWLPGMFLKGKMATARELSKQYVERPFAHSLQNTLEGTLSMVHDALQTMKEKGTLPDESWTTALKEAAATAFLAASETSDSTLMTFFLMMVVNPSVQEKAQAEIDAAVGRARLPTIDDRPSLPYVDAILREILRFSLPTPLSVPRSTTNDDVYDGFYIPKGAIIVTNLWSMAHNESKYPDPDLFLPDRFINDDGSLKANDTGNIAFGFGRRSCVGRYFADTSVWHVIACVLATFSIMKPLDECGNEIQVEPKFSSGASIRPLPFRCRIVPRMREMDKEKLEEFIVSR